jgi:hypothetical protein
VLPWRQQQRGFGVLFGDPHVALGVGGVALLPLQLCELELAPCDGELPRGAALGTVVISVDQELLQPIDLLVEGRRAHASGSHREQPSGKSLDETQLAARHGATPMYGTEAGATRCATRMARFAYWYAISASSMASP